MKNPPTYPKSEAVEGHRPIETVVAVVPPGEAPTSVEDVFQYNRAAARHLKQPLIHVIERREGPADSPGRVLDRFEITLPAVNVIDLGLRLEADPINGIQKGSPADLAGFRKGDRIAKVNGRDDFDPMRLPTIVHENAGKPMTIEVRRSTSDGSLTTQTIVVTPDDTAPWTEPVVSNEALEIPGLGLCYPIRTHVAAVRSDSPAAKAGIKPGDTINAMTINPRSIPEPTRGRPAKPTPAPRPVTITFDDSSRAWVKAFWALQDSPVESVSLVVNKASNPIEITPEADPTWFFPNRGLLFMGLIRKLPPQNISSALRRGWDDTLQNIMNIYLMFRSLGMGRVGPGGLAGPLRIAQVAYDAARFGLTDLVHFLGILSINLAVINFLPIPPLDGGQMLFLIAEKVRGRPLPDSALTAAILIGVFLVICLMIFATYQDVFWYIENWRRL
jgi:regulator of sigma E protease